MKATLSAARPEYIYVKKDPSKIKLRVLFEKESENKEDLLVKINSDGWQDSLCHRISGAEYDRITGKPYEIEFSTLDRKFESVGDLEIRFALADNGYYSNHDYKILRSDSLYDILAPEELKVYNVSGEDLPFWLSVYQNTCRTAFKADEMKVMAVLAKFANVKEVDFSEPYLEMTWNLYSEAGELMGSQSSDFETDSESVFPFARFWKFEDRNWHPGDYKLELKWFDTTLLSAIVKITDANNIGKYDLTHLSTI